MADRYKKVSTDMNFVEREKDVLKIWKEKHIFEKSMEIREGCPTYTFYDGPPTANGKPHIGHVLTRVIKDMIPRYRTMKGYYVPRKAGWDTHGLPVEIEVEKKLNLDGKEQIEAYGMEPFIKQCKESVWKYKGMWEDFSDTVGFWADMEHPYVTYEDDYIESVWWALSEIWKKKLLYKGFKVVPYCPRCGTPLSAQEVAQGYKTVKERSAIVRFKAVGEDAYFLAWTTTPWTLPSNVGLCVNPDETYCKVKAADGYTYYMAKELLDTVLGKLTAGDDADGKAGAEVDITKNENKDAKPYKILEEYKGKDLEHKEYEPLFECAGKAAAKTNKKGFFVICDSYVTMSDGTGIVHTAPAFGEDDNRVCMAYDMPFIQFVDEAGNMTADTPYAGTFVKDADPVILKDLEAEGKLFEAPKFEHEYPHCWRCDTPLIYYARSSWFIKMTQVKDELLKNNDTVNWIPPSIGKGRFGDWLENVQDWGISRNRYWGTPLNIWECECGHQESIGSREDLKRLSGSDEALTVELHRPYIDEITCKCPKCGKDMHRVPEVIDCWFDSGAMPFAQHHYPFENKELFEKQFPAAFISEAVDQTRGWFYSLMAEGTILFGKSPYENCIVLGHVQDENGQKMSKSKGNAVDPFDALEKYGADAIRWYFYINSAPWLPNRFHGGAVVEGQRKFMGTLWNTYAFYVLYANIDDFDATKYEAKDISVMDKWLLAKLNRTIRLVDDHLNNYRIPEAARSLQEFVDGMSNWYVRRCRQRFWAKGMEQDKINAYLTLYTALVEISKAAAPMIPFMADEIYMNLVCSLDPNAPESVHLCDFPTADEAYDDTGLEEKMDAALKLVTLGRATRNEANIKNRQPVQSIYIKSPVALDDYYTDIIAEELNVKEVEITDDVSSYTSYTFKPQLRTVGPKYGKQLGAIKKALSEIADGNKAMVKLKADGVLKLPEAGDDVELTEEDLLIDVAQTEGYMVQSDGDYAVVLNTVLSDELIEEGFVREIVSKLQTMRKEAGFEVMDRIKVYYDGTDRVNSVFAANKDEIAGEVLADEIADGISNAGEGAYTKDWKINGEEVKLSVEKSEI